MSPTFIRTSILAFSSAATMAVTSCTTTGDPSTGGIFWSENKAQQRLTERQNTLENIENQTNSANRKSAQTQKQIDALR
jgi:hypothetical protein